MQQGVPVELVQIQPAVLDLNAARRFVENIDTELDAINPGAFDAVLKHVGRRKVKLTVEGLAPPHMQCAAA